MTTERSTSPKKRRPWLPLAFIGGLLLGWLGIGWWLWPVQWNNSTPAQMAPEFQRAYITAVAEAYALTGDAAQAQNRLSSWDDRELATTLSLLMQEAVDPQTQERYAALAETLTMPRVDVSLLDMILGQKVIVITAVAAVGLFLAAIGLAVLPSIQQSRARRQEDQRMLAGAEPAAEIAPGRATAVAGQPQAAPAAPAAAGETASTGTTPANAPNPNPPQPAEPAADGAGQADAGGGGAAAGQPGSIRAGNSQPQQQPNPANATVQPPAQATTAVTAAPNSPLPPVNNQQQEESQEKLLPEATGGIQELLNSLFEEDDKLLHYEMLLRGLGEVDMGQVDTKSKQVLGRLRRMNREDD
ncbi:MAG: hypothetical protein H6659_16735 [Ardenticatenaceae bacterium]|nr:hypothetical protein [Ardenticatenaceae bacterium]MCB8988259.1 hypothetical protein [Ardenticatenaceae bacterium]